MSIEYIKVNVRRSLPADDRHLYTNRYVTETCVRVIENLKQSQM